MGVWQQMSEQLGLPAKVCQSKWKGLRDGYIKLILIIIQARNSHKSRKKLV